MKLHTLTKTSHKRKKRLGKGPGTGHGKTAGKGHKGAKSRSGYSMPTNYSGIPLYRRLPQRGFSNYRFRDEYAIVNVDDLNSLEGVEEVNHEILVHAGLVRTNSKRIKILGEGELKKALKVTAHKFSASARQKIEAAGGSVVELIVKKEEKPTEAS